MLVRQQLASTELVALRNAPAVGRSVRSGHIVEGVWG